MPRDFWKLWKGATLRNLSGGVAGPTFGLIAASTTRNPTAVAGVVVAFTLPWLLFGLAAGALVDRGDRRRTLIAVDLFCAGVIAVLTTAVAIGETSLALVYVVAFLLGTGETFFDSASGAILPAIVRRDQLADANGRLLAAERVTNEFGGPPLGGIAFAGSAALPLAVGAVGHVVNAAFLVAIHGSFRATHDLAHTTLLADVREGLRWVRDSPPIRTLAALVAVLAFVDTAWFAVLVLFALDVLGVGPTGYGALLAAGGVGGVAGSLAAPRVRSLVGAGNALVLAVVLAAAAQLVLGLTSSVAVALVMLTVSSLGFGIWNVVAVSIRQALVPDRLLGRVTSVYYFFGLGATTIGAVAGGVVADAAGLRAPFLLGVPILAAAAAVSARSLRAVKV